MQPPNTTLQVASRHLLVYRPGKSPHISFTTNLLTSYVDGNSQIFTIINFQDQTANTYFYERPGIDRYEGNGTGLALSFRNQTLGKN